MDKNGNIIDDVVKTITANQSGIGETVLEEGQSLAVVGNSAVVISG